MKTLLRLEMDERNDPKNHADCLMDLELETARIFKKWGVQNHAPVVWLAILTEEVGEVAKEINDSAMMPTKNMYDELIQVAAVAIGAAQNIRRNNPLLCEEHIYG
jgi:NTP pyrophosphatase (non-canonical NTP hydrolase)